MTTNIHAIACRSIHAIAFERNTLLRAIRSGMAEGWRERLKERIDQDERSMRALSRAIGHGPNFVQQLLKDGKDPGFQKLADLLSVLGPDATVYVTSGIRLGTPDQLRATLAANGLPENELNTVLEIIRRFTPANDVRSGQSQSTDQSQPANRRREPTP